MKMSISCEERPEEGGRGEKGVFEGQERQDQEADCVSFGRRLYEKAEVSGGGQNGSSDGWSIDGREPLFKPSSRNPFDQEMEGSDRCKLSGISERSLDVEATAVQTCSPLISCSSDRVGQSERERTREGSPGSSLRTSSNAMDIDDEDVKLLAVPLDSVEGNEHCLPSEDGGKTKIKQSYSEEQPVVSEVMDLQQKGAANCNSEMGEGELEPDPEPNPRLLADPKPELQDGVKMEFECRVKSDGAPRSGGESSSEEKHQVPDDGNVSDRKVKRTVEAAVCRGYYHGMKFHEGNTSKKFKAKGKQEEECAKVTSATDVDCAEHTSVNENNENSGSQGPVKEISPQKGVKVEVKEDKERTLDLVSDGEEELQERKLAELEAESTEVEPMPVILFGPCKDDAPRKNGSEESLDRMMGNRAKGKGKSSSAISLSDEADSVGEDDAIDGPNMIGNFELVFRSNILKPHNQCSSGVASGKNEEDKQPESEPLDLSLGLPCGSRGLFSNNPEARSELLSTCREDRQSSFFSDSLAGSGTFVHNPSCSLTHNSVETNEHSVGSRPLCWHGEPSNESKYKGAAVRTHSRSLLVNGKSTHLRPPDKHDHGSDDNRSDPVRQIRKREKSSSSLSKRGHQGAEDMCSNGFRGTEKVLNKIVCEPLQVICRMIQGMSYQSVTYLRESIGQMVANKDKRGLLADLQTALQKRSDLTKDALSKCHRVVLEILVSLRTSLPDFLLKADTVPSSDLADIFFNIKCRNITCRSIIPVDGCDCKICVQKEGFCSACMCLICSAFDSASNTCGWVGCDVCLHWSHTDCALESSHIRNGLSISGAQKNAEMQFHCVTCGHPSEMFGFVKEVFKACSKNWTSDVLAKELDYVRKIFTSSEDSRGKQLCDVANHLLLKLENRSHHSDVVSHMLSFLTGNSNVINEHSTVPRKGCGKPSDIMSETIRMKCLQSDNGSNHRSSRDIKVISLDKRPIIDELDDVIRLKEAEAKMYQARADDARREAEDLKRICAAKIETMEIDYANEIERLQVAETEKKRKRKFDELQALEQSHCEYINMKTRMETDVKNLLIKMDAARRNLEP